MSSNNKPCETCDHYDPILRGTKPTTMGWCARRSLYPYADSPGQVTPPNAQRVANPEDPARPIIVQAKQIVPACQTYVPKRAKLTKADMLAAAVSGKKSR